ncbi:MAG: hypothetical protein HUU20_01435 [Pirellulales bacterium]|nr:hypothetical protein [Pirellulales bacterium]
MTRFGSFRTAPHGIGSRRGEGDASIGFCPLVCLAAGVLGCALHARGAESQRMSLEVLEPVYRNSIYATQAQQRIVVRATLPETLRSRVVEIRGRLLDSQGRELAAAAPGTELADVVRFDAESLPVGTYTVEMRAMGAGGAEAASARAAIRKLPRSPGSEVRIDAQRNIVIDGKPSVQIGWYGAVRLDDPRPEVLALQNIQTASAITYPDKTPVTKLYREHGIRTMVNLEPARLLYTFELWKQPGHPVPTEHTKRSAPSDECREMLRKMVELFKDEPGLFGWYIADEPEINHFRADYLEAYYRAICELDPYHPVVVTNDTLDGLEKFGYRACDILASDPYGDKPNYVPSFLAKANSLLRPGQGLMLTPWHAAHHTHFTAEYGSRPPFPYRVMRGQYLATLAAGGRGLAGYTSDFFLPEPRLRIGLPHLWREVRFLEPFLQSVRLGDLRSPVRVDVEDLVPAEKKEGGPAAGQTADQSPHSQEILAWIGQSGKHIALIVMNSGLTRRRVAVKHPALAMAKLSVVSEAREVAIENGGFADEIPAGEACVYSTDPRGLKLPTVAQIETEISAFEKNSARPGNLLHAGRGVKARASQGTIPWFAQIYYYAINGITDDEGWHVTHAGLPQWIEFALPSAEPIGRVVLYTPNLRDYDLQFRGADGTTQQAEVRGNTRETAEHVLARPVSTLKLRLVARAVRAGADPPRAMVREIEAHADGNSSGAPRLDLVRMDAPAEPPTEAAALGPSAPPLWRDDFSNFRHKPKHYEGDPEAWVLNAQEFLAQRDPQDKRLRCTVTSPAGYASMGRLLPYSSEHRYFQFSVPEIKGEGYPWLNVVFADPAAKTACSAVHTIKPGRYTADAHALGEVFRSRGQGQVLLNIYLMKGIAYALDEVSLSSQPPDGLAITMADGSPLPRALKEGDELLFRLFLEKPATDAIVESFRDSWYEPVRINGEPYVQLLKSGKEKDGRCWSAVVKLGPKTDKFKVSGYPLLFRAAVTGGAIQETMSTVMVDFQ